MDDIKPNADGGPLERLLHALLYLAGRCDGAVAQDGIGFNGPHAKKGHKIIDNYIQHGFITEADWVWAAGAINTYRHTQLSFMDDLPKSSEVSKLVRGFFPSKYPDPVKKGAIEIVNGSIKVSFDFDWDLVARAKSLPGKRFDKEDKSWFYPLSSYNEVVSAFPDFKRPQNPPVVIEKEVEEVVDPNVIDLDGDLITVEFEFNWDYVNACKSVPGGKFNKPKSRWEYKYDMAIFKSLLEKLGFRVTERLQSRVDEDQAIEDMEKSEAKKEAEMRILMANLNGTLSNGWHYLEHQKEGIKWIIQYKVDDPSIKGRLLADDMGLGKTIQACAAIKALALPAIVSGPAGMRSDWLKTAEIVGVPISYTTHHNKSLPDPKLFPDGWKFILVVDEAHAFQNPDSKRTKAFLELAKRAEFVLLLTGTPAKNGRPINMLPLLQALNHPLAKDKYNFERTFCFKANPWVKKGWDNTGAMNLELLYKQISNVMLRRTKEECLDLPEKTRVLRVVDLSKDDQKWYEGVWARLRADFHDRREAKLKAYREGIDNIRNGTPTEQQLEDEKKGIPLHEQVAFLESKIKAVDKGEALVLLGQLLQAASHAKAGPAIELVEEILDQNHQTVVFTRYKAVGERIANHFGCRFISGDVKPETRAEWVEDFQRGKQKVIVCTFGAAGVGITLTAASYNVLVDRPWTPGDAIQAEDRIYRIGQRNATTVYWLEAPGANDADTRVDQILLEKSERIATIMTGSAEGHDKISFENDDTASRLLGLVDDIFG